MLEKDFSKNQIKAWLEREIQFWERQLGDDNFGDDAGFLRNLAYVESRDGEDSQTFRQGYTGGIWQIDRPQFERTLFESPRLAGEYSLLLTKLGIDWFGVTWNDLLKPLHSGIAAALYLILEGAPGSIGPDTTSQAIFWVSQVRFGRSGQEFLIRMEEKRKSCIRSNRLDLIYVVDTGPSLGNPHWTLVKAHIKNKLVKLHGQSGLGPQGDRVSLVTFSSQARLDFQLGFMTDLSSSLALVDLSPRAPGPGTNTSSALAMARNQVLPDARPDADRVIILITDGAADDRLAALTEAVLLKNLGVSIHAIGVGPTITKTELEQLASTPSCSYAHSILSYLDLDSVELHLERFACQKAPTPLSLGETTHSCSTDFIGQLPTDGRGYAVQIRVSDGSVDILASYNTNRPTAAQQDMQHTLVPAQPVVIQSRDPRPLTIAVKTGGGASIPNQCTGNFTISVDLLSVRIQECNGRFMDLLLLWDHDIVPDNTALTLMGNLSAQLVGEFALAQDKHRVGMALFDQSAHNIMWLRDTRDFPKFLSILRQFKLPGISLTSDLGAVLKWTRQIGLSLQHGARTTSGKTVVIFTTGVPSSRTDILNEASLLRAEGTRVVVVAVGAQFDDQLLTSVAGTSLHLFKVSSLQDVTSKTAELGQAVCADVSVLCVEKGSTRPCSTDDLLNSKYGTSVIADRDLTVNPCGAPQVPGAPSLSRFPHPSRPDRFIICDSKAQAYVVLCPNGQSYNANIRECEFSGSAGTPVLTLPVTRSSTSPAIASVVTAATAAPAVTVPGVGNPCTPGNLSAGNLLHEYPSDKSKYINCSTAMPGQWSLLTCPSARLWVQAVKACRYTCLVVDAAAGTVDCSLPNPCGSGSLQLYSHPTDVSKYIQCGPNQEPLLQTCPPGQIWRPIRQQCSNP
ncbi:collagen alpha-1(xiv) chain [Plakobranchus ocellatus]|uniref:Collagen alpha-1(Xiv) chain n=1 Tax=Plakobranchus ocellatus TaxID=259542 RepID=A0AAV4DY54_9GAST|nr:collagen alpha-1(xiv) chain [Plakobranchus ocellatus]